MKMTELFAGELERESVSTRKMLERVPEGEPDWKPHQKSMPLGYLANLVASLPSWVGMTVEHDFLDLHPPDGQAYRQPDLRTGAELAAAFDEHVAKAREVLQKTTDEHLMTPWQFRVGGKVMMEAPRYIVLRDTVFNHLIHHRGQLSVYLRLNDKAVPSIYGPSADEGKF